MSSTPTRLEQPYRDRAVPPATARYWSWLFSAPQSRAPLLGIYALMAEWRGLMDPATEASAAQLKLAWWQDEIRRLAADAPVHPISRYLAALPRARVVDFRPLSTAIEAAARQIAGAPLERGAQLEAHSAALYANPLLVAANLARDGEIPLSQALRDSISVLAAAQFITAALVDYRREAHGGRVVFPVDELLAAGIEDADLAAADPSPRLQSYLDGLRRRAARLFAAAAHSLPLDERPAMRHLLVIAALGAKHASNRSKEGRLRDLYLAWSTARRAARPT